MSDENLSKRERQKQRRQEKVQAEEKARRASRVRQLVAVGLVVLVLLAGVGVVVANNRAEEQAASAAADEFACTEVVQDEDFGGGDHLDPSTLPDNPPSELYVNSPASAGPHLGSVAASGVYDETVDERLVVHDLEHGYITLWWDPDAPQETIDAVKQYTEDRIGDYPKLIAAPYNTDLPDEQAVNLVGWTVHQSCADGFSPEVADAFLEAHYGLAGVAPEKNLEPHESGGMGVIDPAEDGPLLYPPLDSGGDADAVPTETAPATGAEETVETVTDPPTPAGG